MIIRLAIFTAGITLATMRSASDPPDIDLLWDYNDAAASETRFRELLAKTTEADARLQVQTQIARAQGLQRKFDDAHKTLEDVERSLTKSSPLTAVRYLLERGRVFNSSNVRDKARPLFLQAFEKAQQAKLDFFAVDAAHMMGIIEPADEALKWNEKAVALAERSSDAKAKNWLGALYNNIGWTYYDKKEFAKALGYFQRDEKWYAEHKRENEARIARYSIGKTKRALGQIKVALEIQEALQKEIEEKHLAQDGFVFEELGECHLALGHADDAKQFFGRAYEVLSKDEWFTATEPQRLKRLKELSGR